MESSGVIEDDVADRCSAFQGKQSSRTLDIAPVDHVLGLEEQRHGHHQVGIQILSLFILSGAFGQVSSESACWSNATNCVASSLIGVPVVLPLQGLSRWYPTAVVDEWIQVVGRVWVIEEPTQNATLGVCPQSMRARKCSIPEPQGHLHLACGFQLFLDHLHPGCSRSAVVFRWIPEGEFARGLLRNIRKLPGIPWLRRGLVQNTLYRMPRWRLRSRAGLRVQGGNLTAKDGVGDFVAVDGRSDCFVDIRIIEWCHCVVQIQVIE